MDSKMTAGKIKYRGIQIYSQQKRQPKIYSTPFRKLRASAATRFAADCRLSINQRVTGRSLFAPVLSLRSAG